MTLMIIGSEIDEGPDSCAAAEAKATLMEDIWRPFR